MKHILFFSLAFFFTAFATVHKTDEASFIADVSRQELVLVNFFAPECGRCTLLGLEYEKAASLLSSEHFSLIEVDCTEDEYLCSRFNVNSYPTLQLFRKGKASETYKKKLTADSIVEYMRSQRSAKVSRIDRKDELEDLKKKETILVVGFFSPEDTEGIEKWKDFASKWQDDFAFAVTTDLALSTCEEIIAFPSFAVYKPFDNLKDIDSVANEEKMLEFIRQHSIPFLGSVTPTNIIDYIEAGRPLVYIFSNTTQMKNELDTAFLPIAQDYKQLSFIHINATEYPAQLEFLYLNDNTLPALGVHNFKNGARYPWNDVWEIEHIKRFLTEILENKIEPQIKSQTYPVSSEAVRVLVGKEFNQVFFDKEKDVIVQIYAPWCGHSQKLAPIWEHLAKIAQNIVVAKMDGTTNDVPPSAGFQVNKYPTIKLAKSETNQVVTYTGDRSLNDLVQFIKLHTGDKPIQHLEL